MARDFSRAFYHSRAWASARDLALTRDQGLCRHCLAKGRVTPATMVHHIVELTPANIGDPRYSTDPRNLVSLCDTCHKEVHGWLGPGRTRPGLAFDEDGNLINIADQSQG